MTARTRRLRACVESWPGAETGAYDPRCCRFPKSCSATVYDEGAVAEKDLEPALPTVADQQPAEPEPVPLVDFVVPCRDTREPDGDVCPGEVRYGPGDMQARCTVCRGWRGRYAPGDGPLVSDGEAARLLRALDAVRRIAHEQLIDHQHASAHMKAVGQALLEVVNGPVLGAEPLPECDA